MKDHLVALHQPESFSDPLTEMRAGARQLLGQAIEAEVAPILKPMPI